MGIEGELLELHAGEELSIDELYLLAPTLFMQMQVGRAYCFKCR